MFTPVIVEIKLGTILRYIDDDINVESLKLIRDAADSRIEKIEKIKNLNLDFEKFWHETT